MTIADLGSIGEFVAAIATLGTLIYLALQIRQNSEAVRINAAQSILASLNEALQSAAASPESARVLILGQSDFDQLEEDEKAQFMVWIFGWFRVLEQAHYYHSKGLLADEIWEGQIAHTRQVIAGNAINNWWLQRKSFFSSEFQQFIDELSETGTDQVQPRSALERMSGRGT